VPSTPHKTSSPAARRRPAAPSPMSVAVRTANCRVLLVEDDPDAAFLLREMLRDDEAVAYRVTHVDRLAAALSHTDRDAFDVVLLDLGLPDSQGLDTVNQLAARMPDAPLVVLTGLNDGALAQKALQAGAQDYLVKGDTDGRSLRRSLGYAIERKHAQSDLQASERRLRALIENSADAITLLSPDGTVIHDTPAAPGLLGYGPQEMIGRKFFPLVHPDDQPRISQEFARLAQTPGSKASDTFRLRHKNGQWQWLEAVAHNLLDEPSIRAIVVNYGDVTRRSQAEEAARASEERLRTLVNSLDEAIFTLDRELRNVGVFGGWYEKQGVPADRYLNRTPREIFPPELAALHEQFDRRALAGESVTYEWADPTPPGPGAAGPVY